ncbi:MAG TPA: acetyl-CoA acetyltransferase [Acidimicrobiales bacterium]|nr:acetyl-CoA acetyltransferase [Acidimicrobiales bacterium]
MPLDPNSPVIVGVAQSKRRPQPTDDLENLSEPAEMMAEVAALAIQDSGSDRIADLITSIGSMGLLSWGYLNPGALVADKLGIDIKESILTTTGGNSPQMLVNRAASAIAAGELDAALIVGAEAVYSRLLQSKAVPPVHGKWTRRDDETAGPAIQLGEETQGNHQAEMARSMVVPIQVYPVFENALRAALGRSLPEHRSTIAHLWAQFSEVAASNPFAWAPQRRSASEIETAGPDNRMICYPYTKLMNANIQTDQAAALIVCSVDVARSAGISEDRWVFVRSGAEAHDHWFISNRDSLCASPALRICGQHSLQLAGAEIDDVAHFDLYSCFPSAVQIAARELGLPIGDPSRPLTVTGGLGFAGGPGNNYVTHSIAAMVDKLRSDPGTIGLVNAVGWYLTKHAVGIYSTDPGNKPFGLSKPQDEVDLLPSREVIASFEGSATLESYTVAYDRNGEPEKAIVACLTDDGKRAWANSTDPDLMEKMVTVETIGTRIKVTSEGLVS